MITHAVIVGIEKYREKKDASMWDLPGPANDALRFAKHLLSSDVNSDNVALFLSPLDSDALDLSFVDSTGRKRQLEYRPPTHDEILRYIIEDLEEISLERFILYWSGHGFLDRKTGHRGLFTADARVFNAQNINLYKLRQFLRSPEFAPARMALTQLIYIDACADDVDLMNLIGRPESNMPTGSETLEQRQQFLIAASPDGKRSYGTKSTGQMTHHVIGILEEDDNYLAEPLNLFEELTKRMASNPVAGIEQTPVLLSYSDILGNEREAPIQFHGDMLVATWQPKVAEGNTDPPSLPERNDHHIGRDRAIKTIRDYFESNRRRGIPVKSALIGPSGIGKSEIALEYAYRCGAEYYRVFWFEATTREKLETNMLQTATRLGLAGTKDTKDISVPLRQLRRWFEKNPGWLIILDDVKDEEMLATFLPGSPHGHIIVTTQNESLNLGKANYMSVSPLGKTEAVALLKATAGLNGMSSAERSAAEHLSNALFRFPDALNVAAKHVRESGTTFQRFLQQYVSGQEADPEAQKAIFRLVEPLLVELQTSSPAALAVIRLSTVLGPGWLPVEVLLQGRPHLGAGFSEQVSGEFALDKVFKELRRFSLITRNIDDKSFRILERILPAEMYRLRAEQTGLHDWVGRAVAAVSETFPFPEIEHWAKCARLLPIAKRCLELIRQFELKRAEDVRLLLHAGAYLRERAQFADALKYLHASADIVDATEEEDLAAERAETYHALADCFRERNALGDREKALHYYNEAIGIWARLDNTSLGYAWSLNNLGLLYRREGSFHQAHKLLRTALQLREHSPDIDIFYVAQSFSDIGTLYRDENRYEEAEQFYARALAILQGRNEKRFRFQLAYVQHNLAEMYLKDQKHELAEQLFSESLDIRRELYGTDHQHYGGSLYGLANLKFMQGKLAQSEDMLNQVFSIWIAVFGKDHHDLAWAYHLRGKLMESKGHLEQAEESFKVAFNIRLRDAPNHLHTVEVANDYAAILTRLQKDASQPLNVSKQILNDKESFRRSLSEAKAMPSPRLLL